MFLCNCRQAKFAARRAQEEADSLKAEAARAREKAADLLANLRAAEDDVSALRAADMLFYPA